MTRVVFFEKPGCSSNAKQKQILRAAGVELDVRNLLEHRWQREELRRFFSGKPVAEWFNKNAPAVKSGEIDPATFSAEAALDAMLLQPLLIRRPLIAAGELRECGFEWPALAQRLGIAIDAPDTSVQPIADLESCKHKHSGNRCNEHDHDDHAGAA